jgi:hypothetical protein
MPIFTQRNFPQKQNLEHAIAIGRHKFSVGKNFEIFGKFSVRGNFSLVEMSL